MGKKYKTRRDYELKIYSTDNGSDYPVHGAYKALGDDYWAVACWDKFGSFRTGHEGPFDLIEVKEPERVEFWLSSYSNFNLRYKTKESALNNVLTGCQATFGIEILIHDDGRKEVRIIEVV
jgi:hypothetical protein